VPTLIRFLVIVGILAGLVYGGMIALVTLVKVEPREMSQSVEIPKAQPRLVADRSLDGWQAERTSVFPDRLAEMVEHAVLGADPLLSSLDADERGRMVAVREADGSLRFDIHLQGTLETPFLTFPGQTWSSS